MTRGQKPLVHEGKTVKEWAAELGIRPDSVRRRIKLGTKVDRPKGKITTPIKTDYRGPRGTYKKCETGDKAIEWNGEKHSITTWSNFLGIHNMTLRARLARGWTVERTFTTPVAFNKGG